MPMEPPPQPKPPPGQRGMTLGSALCTQCGLCCTGTVHDYASLAPEEADFARGLGLELVQGDRSGFALPCPRLQGCSCTIYESRPRVCSRYKCQLLMDLEGGATDLATAVDKVQHAKKLIQEVERELPSEMTLPEARKQFLTTEGNAPVDPRFMTLKLVLTVLCLYIDMHFKHGRETKFLSLEPMRPPRDLMEME